MKEKKINKVRRNKLLTTGRSLAALLAMLFLPTLTSLGGKKEANKSDKPTVATWG